MRIQITVLVSLLAAGAVQAQTAPPAARSDSWSAPAPASTASYRSAAHTVQARPQASHFKFKERRSPVELPGNAAQEHSGKAAVMGEVDRNGRPAVSCPQTPMDPACH